MVQSDLFLFVIGFVAAAASGYLCVKLLLQFLQKNAELELTLNWLTLRRMQFV
jgi:undecaprenyl pyrophosphate phosphatase UppP